LRFNLGNEVFDQRANPSGISFQFIIET